MAEYNHSKILTHSILCNVVILLFLLKNLKRAHKKQTERFLHSKAGRTAEKNAMYIIKLSIEISYFILKAITRNFKQISKIKQFLGTKSLLKILTIFVFFPIKFLISTLSQFYFIMLIFWVDHKVLKYLFTIKIDCETISRPKRKTRFSRLTLKFRISRK